MHILRQLAAIALAAAPLSALGWSQKGHDVTAYIAEQHLTPATAAAVDSLLDGRSLVYWANWLDNASHTAPYDYTLTWHYINVDKGKTYETAPRNPKGDIVTALRSMIEVLADTAESRDEKALALKIVTHLAGDLHQPMHTGHATDFGGNTVTVKYFDSDRKLHAVWDSSLPESAHKWSYTEWQQQIDRANPAEQAVIISGNIDDWTRQSLVIAGDIYEAMSEGKKVSYNEIAYWTPVIEDQLLKGGLRLAHILNLVFDPAYTSGSTLITKATDL